RPGSVCHSRTEGEGHAKAQARLQRRRLTIASRLIMPTLSAKPSASEAGAMNHQKNMLKVFSGRANVPLAEKISQCLGDSLGKITLQSFPEAAFSARIDE